MEDKNRYYDDNFIARWVSGLLSTEEKNNFHQWLRANPQEKNRFDNINSIWAKTGKLNIKKSQTQEQRWQAISSGIFLRSEPGQPRSYALPIRRVLSVAAAIIIIFGAYYWSTGRQVVTENAPRGVHKNVMLPGGSIITLNAESTLRYNKTNWGKKREVVLQGEAFFNVTAGKKFIVISDFVTIKVLGTSFNVKSRNNKVEIACLTGRVSVESNLKEGSPVLLTPEFASSVEKTGFPEQPYRFVIKDKTGWLTREFNFSSVPLIEVFDEIERQFNCSIKLNQEIDHQLFTGSLDGKSAGKTLEIVCLSSGLQYKLLEDSTFVVY